MNRLKPYIKLLEYLPLPTFLISMHLLQPQSMSDWLAPYLFASTVAVIAIGLQAFHGNWINRLYLSINLYFFSGALGLLINWVEFNHLNGVLAASGMLIWVSFFAISASIWPKINLFNQLAAMSSGSTSNRKTILKLSQIYAFVFFVIASLAALFSYRAQGNLLLSDVGPFILVFTSFSILKSRIIINTEK